MTSDGWNLSADGCTLIVSGGKQSSERFAVKSSDVLRKLDLQGREITSNLNYDLRRTSAFERIEPRLAMRGKFRYMADAPTFAECQSGQRWPVSMEGEYKALEGAYLNTRRQAGEELLATIEGQVVMRPNADGGAPFATAPLQETYWKLMRLGDKPVILAEKQREPSLIFRSQQNRVTGFGGCNNLTGAYKLSGDQITFMRVAATRRACLKEWMSKEHFSKRSKGPAHGRFWGSISSFTIRAATS
jgi:copper homeostasis protein (lipoprotein)